MIINSTTSKAIFGKRGRINLFFEELNKSTEQFYTAQDAHAYLKETLVKIESEYGSHTMWKMTLAEFTDFKFNTVHNVYYINTTNQAILLHKNGAYGIYQDAEHAIDFEFFKTGGTKIVEKNNHQGLSVWSACKEIT